MNPREEKDVVIMKRGGEECSGPVRNKQGGKNNRDRDRFPTICNRGGGKRFSELFHIAGAFDGGGKGKPVCLLRKRGEWGGIEEVSRRGWGVAQRAGERRKGPKGPFPGLLEGYLNESVKANYTKGGKKQTRKRGAVQSPRIQRPHPQAQIRPGEELPIWQSGRYVSGKKGRSGKSTKGELAEGRLTTKNGGSCKMRKHKWGGGIRRIYGGGNGRGLCPLQGEGGRTRK